MRDMDNSNPNFEENSDWTSRGKSDNYYDISNGGKITSILKFIGSDEQS